MTSLEVTHATTPLLRDKNNTLAIMKFLFGVFLSSVISCAFFSCTNIIDDKDYKIDSARFAPELAVPLAFGSLHIKDILSSADSQYVKIYPDGLVYLSYSQSLKSGDIRNLITIPDQSLNRSFPIPAGTFPPSTQDTPSGTIANVIDLGLSPEKLSEILFKTGSVNYSTTVSPANPNLLYEIVVSLPDFTSTITNTPLTQHVSGSGSFSLKDYKAALNGNQFNLTLDLIIKQNSSSVTIAPGTVININLSFAGLDFAYVKGFFGDQTVNIPAATLDIGTFNTSLNGANVSFAQPKINFAITNDYGVPTTIDFQTLEARKTGAALAVQLNPPNPVAVSYPTTLGSSSQTNLDVTNAAQLINFAPTQFYYNINTRINAGLTSANPVNFMADTSKFRVKMNVEIPLYGHASNIILADTATLDLGSVDQSKIAEAYLKVKVSNEVPLDANIQFYLTDANYVFIDSLLATTQTNFIPGSKVDSNGELLTPGAFDQLIQIDATKLSKVFSAKKIIIKARVTTSKGATGNLPDVKFKSQYEMDVNLGLKTKLKVAFGL
ncbi:MAG TPA: hypothetical protein VL728_10350 [Cyclobacteriaceae bacterium]|jgi:hypothetical protein|nr:hypothetical protein [Cyclobacteriaceae bacterium]